ncbi:MAG TPA: ribosome biogenesis GTP-binding protein YihA/YsxC [Stellaceae bacterium]|nr:ribosome biogenesis GTP-binding protein YihA/YsxC [Stellaceae bacterium]
MGDHAPRGRRLSAPQPETGLFPPRELAAEQIELGRLLFARDCRFIAGGAEPDALPAEGLPEIAFLGRSNVGKSSLVNALTGRRMLARTSNTPGRTRQLNFFALDNRLMLVDLPGYGYAEASKSAVAAWTRLVTHYLRGRASLRRVCLLIDARHGLKEPDRPVMQLCDRAGLSYQVVLTKIDKLAPADRAAIAQSIAGELAVHPAAHPEVHLTSAEKGLGIAALRAGLAGFALPAAPRRDVAAPAVALRQTAR